MTKKRGKKNQVPYVCKRPPFTIGHRARSASRMRALKASGEGACQLAHTRSAACGRAEWQSAHGRGAACIFFCSRPA